jgi:hypothetical protein
MLTKIFLIRIIVWTFLSKLQVQELVKKEFTNFQMVPIGC